MALAMPPQYQYQVYFSFLAYFSVLSAAADGSKWAWVWSGGKWWGGGLDLNMLLLQEQGSIVGFAWVDSHLDLWLIVCNGSAFL